MNRFPVARLLSICLVLTLFTGVQAKAIGIGSCPMHQAAAHDHDRVHHHQHDGHASGKIVCNCLDACQTGCQPAFSAAEGIRRVAEAAAPAEPAAPYVQVRAAVAVRAHLLPFSNAPPFLS